MVYKLKLVFGNNFYVKTEALYRKLECFFNRKASGNVAKERLKLLLISDRAGCSPETLDLIRKDMINVISKYIDIDKEQATIRIEKSTTPYLFANIPIKEVKYK